VVSAGQSVSSQSIGVVAASNLDQVTALALGYWVLKVVCIPEGAPNAALSVVDVAVVGVAVVAVLLVSHDTSSAMAATKLMNVNFIISFFW
jgi:hypothetical protein